MKFKKPEDLSALNDKALEKALNDALDEYSELVKVDDAKVTDEQLSDMEALKEAVTEIKAEKVSRETDAEARAERIKAAKEAPADEAGDEDESEEDEESEVEDEDGEEDADEDESEEDEDEDADADADAEKKEPVLASGKRPKVTRRAVTRRRKAPVEKEEEDEPRKAVINAQADVQGFASGQEIDMDGLTQGYLARLKGFPGKGAGRKQFLKNGLAQITKPGFEQFAKFDIDVRDSQEVAWSNLMHASRQENVGGSLVAAGGWCAPSENFYDLCQWETATGALDLPEITVRRGGINFTKGPNFADIYTNTGFTQTEADAIAGEVKDFLEVECPDWTEVRLDAIGYGVKAPILTGSPAGFPELIRRYLEGALVAHFHRVNAYVINKVLAFLGAAENFVELGSGTGDLLYAVEIAAQRLRYKYRLGEGATLEAMFPMWALSAIRADLAYRTGVDSFLGVTDAQIRSWFTLRGIRPQFVYDWTGMDLTGSELAFPTNVQFGIWPAGAFVKGTNNVISLDAIYDSTEIETNTYTAAFFEEAILVANTCGDGDLWQVALDYHGRTGAAQVGGTSSS